MRKISRTFLFIGVFILITTNTSCMLIIKMMGLYKDPKPETPETIIAYCKENNAYYDYLYMPKNDTAAMELIKRRYHRMVTMEPFNNQQQAIYVNHKNGPNGCSNATAAYYQSQDTAVAFCADNNFYFWDKLSFFQLIDKKAEIPVFEDNYQNYDYYLMLTWSKMMPKSSKGSFESLYESSLIDSSKNVCVILLDFDARGGKAFFKEVEKMNKKAKKAAKKQAKKEEKQSK